MDEILFHLSNQIELLQIHGSVIIEQTEHFLNKSLLHGQQIIYNVNNYFQGEEFKDLFQQIYTWFQRHINTINSHIPTINVNPKYFYKQIKNVCVLYVSKKELIYFGIGLLSGTAIGCAIILKYYTPHHVQYMKAIVCQYYFGTQGVILIEDAEMPIIQKSNEVLIQIKAAAFHEVDLKICSGYSKTYRRLLNTGKYKSLPVILGRGCAGVVADIGHDVVNFDIGDKVFLAVPSWSIGTMAEYIVIPEAQVAKMPKILPFESSASLPYSGCIAWDALVNDADIKEGDAKQKRVLVYEGSTSVGCILIQLIKLWGGHTVAICKPQAAQIIKALGADEIIVYNEVEIFKELELHDKFDFIFFTGGIYTVNEKIIKQYLLPNGSFISTIPENLISDSFGCISETLFAGYIKVKLILEYVFGANMYHWNEGRKIKTSYLQSLRELADTDQLQPILDKVYTPQFIDQALLHLTSVDAIGSTIIKFQ